MYSCMDLVRNIIHIRDRTAIAFFFFFNCYLYIGVVARRAARIRLSFTYTTAVHVDTPVNDRPTERVKMQCNTVTKKYVGGALIVFVAAAAVFIDVLTTDKRRHKMAEQKNILISYRRLNNIAISQT